MDCFTFHNNYCLKGETLVIIKSTNDKILGGYTDIPCGNNKKEEGNSFLFSLREDSNFVKLKSLDKDN